MNRRQMLSVASVGILAAGSALAQTAGKDHDHAHHGAGKAAKLAASALHCVSTGQACIDHCLDSFAKGDTSLAICARKVDELISICGTLAKLASTNSPHLGAMTKLALAVCKDCEAECRKHQQHPTCKACADACVDCAKECQAFG